MNGRPQRPSAGIQEGDLVEYEVPEPVTLAPQPEAIPLQVVYEDEDLVVIDKAAGMVVHPAPGNQDGTFVPASWGNQINRLLRAAIRGMGIAVDNTNNNMLLQAIQAAQLSTGLR